MTNNGIVQIHGKDYMTVARRVELAQEDKALEGVETEVLSHDPVVIKARVTLKGKIYTGISSVSLDSGRVIEKSNPYEVAETSAIGRALGFAGYGIVEGIASADEIAKGGIAMGETNANHPELNDEPPIPEDEDVKTPVCSAHDRPVAMTKGYSKTKRDLDGNLKTYWFHKENGKMCFGSGFKD